MKTVITQAVWNRNIRHPSDTAEDAPGRDVALARGLIKSTSRFPAAMSTPLSLYVSPLWDKRNGQLIEITKSYAVWASAVHLRKTRHHDAIILFLQPFLVI